MGDSSVNIQGAQSFAGAKQGAISKAARGAAAASRAQAKLNRQNARTVRSTRKFATKNAKMDLKERRRAGR